MLQACKPDFVPGCNRAVIIYLSRLSRDQSAYPVPRSGFRRSLGEQPSKSTIRGISACKVYPPMMLPSKAVGSYPTFSPFPRLHEVVIFCGTVCKRLPVSRRLAGVLPFAVRTFLSDINRNDNPADRKQR